MKSIIFLTQTQHLAMAECGVDMAYATLDKLEEYFGVYDMRSIRSNTCMLLRHPQLKPYLRTLLPSVYRDDSVINTNGGAEAVETWMRSQWNAVCPDPDTLIIWRTVEGSDAPNTMLRRNFRSIASAMTRVMSIKDLVSTSLFKRSL